MNKIKIDDNLLRLLLLIFLLFILYNFILLPLGFLQPLRLNFNDMLFNSLRNISIKPAQISEIVVVKIDEETLINIGKKWPWNRIFFAEAIEKVANYNPKLIGIDITFFGESTNLDEDQKLAEAIKKAGNIILPSYITEKGNYLTPYAPFLAQALGYGFVNKVTDPDYKVRKARIVYQDPSLPKKHFSFEVILAAAYHGVNPDKIIYKDGSIVIHPVRSPPSPSKTGTATAASGRLTSNGVDKKESSVMSNDLVIPVEKNGTLYINYLPIPSISSISLLDILQDKTELKDFFKDKIILIGQTSMALHDVYQTQQGLVPGVFINAFTLNTILKQTFIRNLPNSLTLTSMFILLLITIVFIYYSSLPKGTLLVCAETILVAIVFLIFSLSNWQTDYFSFLFLLITCYAAANIYKYSYLLYTSNRLKRMVITDSLTGLATPRYFQFKLQLDMSKLSEVKAGISLVVFNVPEFQDLLKKYTKQHLELVLRQFSLILKQNSRKKVDLLSRWREDKFAAILLKTDIKDAEIYSQKIISKLEENEFILPDTIIRLTIYAGISNYPATKTETSVSLITCAETASNRARITSQKICVFNPQKDKVRVDIAKGENLAKEEDYITVDIEEREKELLGTLNELKKSQEEIQKAHFETILSLVKALEEKDPYTAGHSERVANYAVGIAKQLGLEESEITLIRQSALLHDVGKFGLPDKILHKKEALTEEEINAIKKHPVLGQRILEKSKFFEDHIPLILHHHERYDGKGYPHGLSGKFIPKGAQIICIADAIDAMTSGRGYNRILNIEEAVQELKKQEGIQFDPDYTTSAIDFLRRTSNVRKTASSS